MKKRVKIDNSKFTPLLIASFTLDTGTQNLKNTCLEVQKKYPHVIKIYYQNTFIFSCFKKIGSEESNLLKNLRKYYSIHSPISSKIAGNFTRD